MASNLSTPKKPKRSAEKANYVLVESVFSLNPDAFPNPTTPSSMNSPKNSANAYWRANLKLVGCLLLIWFAVSFGCGILFKEELDQFYLGGAPFGFWMAQQGSILCFVGLLIAYSFFMNKLDKEHGFVEEEED